MRLGVVSDLHLTTDRGARASWHNAFDFEGLPRRIDRARDLFRDADVDAVIVCGDVAHGGDEASVRSTLERLSGDRGRRVLVVAGNHDVLARDDQLERSLPPGCELLGARGIELDGLRLAGVAVEREPEAGTVRWVESDDLGGGEHPTVVASHFPVVSRARRLADAGLKCPRGLANRRDLCERLSSDGAVIVLSGHVHARESHARGGLLQLSAGALVEAPYEVAIVDVWRTDAGIGARRRVTELGPPPAGPDPVLAPADETWESGGGVWTRR